jgi:fibronectin type 3 domain-containing protein
MKQVAQITVPMYLDTNVTLGSSYVYTVTALNGNGGKGPVSQELPVLMPLLPRAPSSLVANAGDGRVVLSWIPPSSDGGSLITGYKVFRGLRGMELTVLGMVTNGTGYVDETVVNRVTYIYAVMAENAVGEGPSSVTVSATPVRPPGPPTGFELKMSSGEVYLTWKQPSDDGPNVTGYQVLRGESIGELQVIAGSVTGQEFTDTNVRSGATYYYAVVALIDDVGGTPSDTKKAVIGGQGPNLILEIGIIALMLLIAIVVYAYIKRRD